MTRREPPFVPEGLPLRIEPDPIPPARETPCLHELGVRCPRCAAAASCAVGRTVLVIDLT